MQVGGEIAIEKLVIQLAVCLAAAHDGRFRERTALTQQMIFDLKTRQTGRSFPALPERKPEKRRVAGNGEPEVHQNKPRNGMENPSRVLSAGLLVKHPGEEVVNDNDRYQGRKQIRRLP